MSLLSLFSANEWRIRKLLSLVKEINGLEEDVKSWSDEDFARQTDTFREQLKSHSQNEQSNYEEIQKNFGTSKIPEERQALQLETEAAEALLKEKEQEYLKSILPLAFAMTRESAYRTIGLRHFDVQLAGGIALHEGSIAEMKTGEGKTLAATAPLYLNALAGHGVQLVTVNDYLAKRDCEWMRPVYEFMGLTVDFIDHFMDRSTRRQIYKKDIVYVTNSELGFEYLWDNTEQARRKDDLVIRDFYFAIVDEVDNILVDEARTPLIISGIADKPTTTYYKVDRVIRQLKEDDDYDKDEKSHNVTLTENGTIKVERALGVSNISDTENFELYSFILNGLKAHALFERDKHYMVNGNEIVIVDEFTGRPMHGRRWSNGIHQAVEAKEGCRIQRESQTMATITLQNLFRMYFNLSGMTGTAKTEESEFIKIYGMSVIVIPTHKPMVRKDYADVIYKTEEAKYRGIVRDILSCHCRKQPVLVGTRSISVSENISDRLNSQYLQLLVLCTLTLNKLNTERPSEKNGDSPEDKTAVKMRDNIVEKKEKIINDPQKNLSLLNGELKQIDTSRLRSIARKNEIDPDVTKPSNVKTLAAFLELDGKPEELDTLATALRNGISHNVLNAKPENLEREGEIISEAGRLGMVTVATNMAGRGVDIILGGKPNTSSEANQNAREVNKDELCEDAKCEVLTAHNKGYHEVLNCGGIQIIGTERHESRRIDNQLRGRSGRQGDPGASRFYLSFDDELWRLFGEKTINHPWLRSWPEEEPIASRMVTKLIEGAQKKVEMHNFEIRRHTLRYDDVMNYQRERIYSDRKKILLGADMRANILDMVNQTIESYVDVYCSEAIQPYDWNIKGLNENLEQIIFTDSDLDQHEMKDLTRDEILETLCTSANDLYESKEERLTNDLMRELERTILLGVIDAKWIDHLADMDHLREGIGLRGHAQRDPLVEYQREGHEMFSQLMASIREEVVKYVVHLEPEMDNGHSETSVSQLQARHGELPAGPDPSKTIEPTKLSSEKSKPNDPCPCQSGKKYKRCCMLKASNT